jgi:hypothetical protein
MLFLVAFVLIAFSFFVGKVQAASQGEINTSVGSDGIFRAITQGQAMPPITFHLFMKGGDYPSSVTLYIDGLDEQNGASTINKELIQISPQSFVLNKSDLVEITISVRTADIISGMYKGKITIQADNATNKEIPLRIQVSQTTWLALGFNAVGVATGIGFTYLGIYGSAHKIRDPKRQEEALNLVKITKTNVMNNYRPILVFSLVLIFVTLTTFNAFYPKMGAFGANVPGDYISAILIGFTQVGASKITADIFKK